MKKIILNKSFKVEKEFSAIYTIKFPQFQEQILPSIDFQLKKKNYLTIFFPKTKQKSNSLQNQPSLILVHRFLKKRNDQISSFQVRNRSPVLLIYIHQIDKMKEEELSYKKINIQTLQDRPHLQGRPMNKNNLCSSLNSRYKFSEKPTLCYNDSGLGPQRIIVSNGLLRSSQFFHAFQKAYINHGDIVLIPDEIWIMIMLHVSTYIDKNAEKLRHKLVTFQGKKTLRVVEPAASPEDSLLQEHNWNHFFNQIIKMIKNETVGDVTENLQCNFSTTNKIYELISTSIIMNSFKKFFKYERMMAGCGINNAYMAGQREDWVKIKTKLLKLGDLDINGKLNEYIKYMSIILDNFLLTFDGTPDVKWWNTIMTTPEKRKIYGGDPIVVQGWILYFFGIYKQGDASALPDYGLKVPIKLINTYTKTTKELILTGDWVSISKLDERTYKPDIGMSIVVNKVIKDDPLQEASQKQEKVMKKLEKIYMKPANGIKKPVVVKEVKKPVVKEVKKPVVVKEVKKPIVAKEAKKPIVNEVKKEVKKPAQVIKNEDGMTKNRANTVGKKVVKKK